jgi:hypothetical protein
MYVSIENTINKMWVLYLIHYLKHVLFNSSFWNTWYILCKQMTHTISIYDKKVINISHYKSFNVSNIINRLILKIFDKRQTSKRPWKNTFLEDDTILASNSYITRQEDTIQDIMALCSTYMKQSPCMFRRVWALKYR